MESRRRVQVYTIHNALEYADVYPQFGEQHSDISKQAQKLDLIE